MRGALIIARREFLAGLASKRFYVIGGLLLATMLLGAIVGPGIEYGWFQEENDPSDPGYEEERARFRPDALFSLYLALPLLGGLAVVQLLAIILTSDAVCSEWQRRTLFLLLSKPVDRSGFVVGKFLGTFGTLAAFLVPLSTVVFLVMHARFDFALDAGRIGAFFGAIGIVLLGAASFTAFSVLASSVTRSTTLSMLAALVAWLLVFPLIGLTGFFITLADDDFVQGGEFDYGAAVKDCGEDPRYARSAWEDGSEEPTQEDMEVWKACWAKHEKVVDDWFAARGLEPYDYEAAQEACIQDSTNDTEMRGCQEEVRQQQTEYQEQQERLLREKWNSPRIDWSRYLSPSWTMSTAPNVLNETASNPMTAIFGGDGTPASRWGSIAAMVGHTGLFLGASVWIVRKRDFH